MLTLPTLTTADSPPTSTPTISTEPTKTATNTSLRRLQLITPSSCNLTLYDAWKQQQYFGSLLSDSSFWMYQTQPQIVLTNELALDLAVRGCTRLFGFLYTYRAGRMGPITIQDSYKIMCRPYCMENDNLHEQAMAASGCSCLELSTQPGEVAFTKEGDWCSQNTGRLLCDLVGYCGVWNCPMEDFMCPRYEWNKKNIMYKGMGTCIRGSASTSALRGHSLVQVFLSLMLASWLFFR
jgi:hypothetical protein